MTDRRDRARFVRAHPRRASAGLTLLELLLTMAILGIVFGAGVGILVSMDLTSSSAAGLARAALATTATAARREGAPARLEVQGDGRALVVVSPRTVGTWHFERDDAVGARDLVATTFGARSIDDGHIGRAMTFRGGPEEARIELGLELGSGLDIAEGFSVELAVRREGTAPGRIIDVAGVAGIDALRDGAIRGWIRPERVDASGHVVEGARRDVEAAPGALAPDRWTRIALVYDRVELRLVVDGFPAGLVEERAPVARARGGVVLGGKPRAFPGAVDTVVVRTMERSEPLELPPTSRWPSDAPGVVRFEADGALDRSRHRGGIELRLETDTGDRPLISVSAYGVVQ
jgi:prepilin-type N-terminal cleavage/methylation domain-containing protein